MRRLSGRGPVVLLAASFVAGLAGCSGDTNWVRDAAVWSGVGAERRPAPEFVTRSRPAALDYTPVGVAAPARELKAKPPAAVKAAEAEMDAVRAGNQARAIEARQAGAAVPAAQPPVLPPSVRP